LTDYDRLMNEGAEAIYSEIGERHGYSGLTAGLAAVLRHLGFPVTRWMLSRGYHDPLAEFGESFATRPESFEEIVRKWNQRWFGLGTGRFGDLPYPWNNLTTVLGGSYSDERLDLTSTEKEVTDYLRKKKIRRRTRAYDAFVRENAAEVLRQVENRALARSSELAQRLKMKLSKTRELAEKAGKTAEDLEFGARMRQALLDAAGISSHPITDVHETALGRQWAEVLRQLREHEEHLTSEITRLERPSTSTEMALAALSRSPTLAPFAAAGGVVLP